MRRSPRLDRRGRRRGAVAAILAVVAVLATGCSTAPIDIASAGDPAAAHLRGGDQIATIPADAPVPVTTDPAAGPQADRIIAIDRNGTLAATVFALGLGPHVVGRDGSTTFTAAAGLPQVTDPGHAINVERVLEQRPTIILTGEDANPNGVLDQLRAAHVNVVTFSPERSVAGTPALIRKVAAALGAEKAGEQLVTRTESQIAEAKAAQPTPTGDPTIAFLYIRGERLILLAGPGSGADDLIENLGGRDAGTEAGMTAAFTVVGTESLTRADPEVILVMTQGADSVGGMDKVLALPAVAGTRAGRAHRIVAMDETQILSFGPDVGLILTAMSKAIYR
ncbi:MAG: ABC transporter substrate-binding protein [Gordonia sp. (in: high G+C Gram-positive bacteria)]|uniref:heme/hemin ABC transporter substrate-binding protein n=1 Tax=Gordonia sp. (in: high G+C Gram-positive bacteria) TaxID=84139 RepID=UPI0039E28F0E